MTKPIVKDANILVDNALEAMPDGGAPPLDVWNGYGDWNGTPANWSTGSPPGTSAEAEIQSGVAALTTSASVNSVLVDAGAQLNVTQIGSLTTNTILNLGALTLNSGGGDGGGSMSLKGVLTNVGAITIGNNTLGASTTLKASELDNTGGLHIWGNQTLGSTDQATLDVTGPAPATLTGEVDLHGDADLEFGSGGITAIASGVELQLDGAQSRVSIGAGKTNSALSSLVTNAGTFDLEGDWSTGPGGTSVTTTTSLVNTGVLDLDVYGGDGASSLTVGGALNNLSSITIGNSQLSASTTLTVSSFDNTGGVHVWGNETLGTKSQATLDITGAAPTTFTGEVDLHGDADLAFGSGGITAIAYGASFQIDGAQSRASIGVATGNTALTGLVSNAGTFDLEGDWSTGPGGASVNTTSSLVNTGILDVDVYGGDGASSMNIGGTLINSHDITIGNADLSVGTTVTATGLNDTGQIILWGNSTIGATGQATLDITGAAPKAITGSVILYNDTDLEFGSGGITAIAMSGYLEQDGAQARISIGADTKSTALSKLGSNAGTFRLLSNNGAYGSGGTVVTTTTGFNNSGALQLDIYGGDGGTNLTLGGVLTNAGDITVGNSGLSAPDMLTATGLDNTGQIILWGDSASGTTDQATLDITGAAPTSVTGSLILYNDTDLEFGSGGITSIASGGYLEQDGAQARISIGADTKSTALSKLGSNAGTFRLLSNNGAYGSGGTVVTTTTGLTNSGALQLDIYGGDGGTNLTLGGALTNSGAITIGNSGLSASDVVTATGLNNTGSILLWGNSGIGTTDQVTLDITGAAPATLSGSLILYNDVDVEFARGGITAIAAGAYLEDDGGQARISIGAGATNSALSKLAANAGTLRILGNNGGYGAGTGAVTTTTDFTNSGAVQIDIYGGNGGTGVTIGGVLTNSGNVTVGNGGPSAASTLKCTGLNNYGSIDLYGSVSAVTTLTLSGDAANLGAVYIGGGAELNVGGKDGFDQVGGTTTINGTLIASSFVQTSGATTIGGALAVSTLDVEGGLVDFTATLSKGDGVGALDIFPVGTLQFSAAVDSSHTVTFEAASGTLELGAPASFAGIIAGFSGNDVIDLLGTSVTKLSYSGNSKSGVLTVSNAGGTVATLAFSGSYTTANFISVSDGHGGTDILDPARTAPAPTSASPQAFVAAMAGLGASSGAARVLHSEEMIHRPLAALVGPRVNLA